MTPVLDPEGAHPAALRRLGDFSGRRVLELGCGDGRLTLGIAREGGSVVAFDPDADAIERASRTLPDDLSGRVAYRVASAKEIELEPHSFDLVVFSWSLWCVDPEDVVYVLGRMVEAVRPGGDVLDLQVIRPNPTVETDGRCVCRIDGEPLFRTADAATAAVDALVRTEALIEQAIDDHDVREHFDDGADLVDAYATRRRQLPTDALPTLRALARPCVVRERCRLRRLRVPWGHSCRRVPERLASGRLTVVAAPKGDRAPAPDECSPAFKGPVRQA